jgi:glycosyltransferase 2 family protein
MRKNGRLLLLTLVKAAITVSLIVFICSKIDFSVLARHLRGSSAIYLCFGTLLLIANIPLVAARWWLILRRLDVTGMPFAYTFVATYAGLFIGQLAPGAVGFDAARGWLAYRRGAKLRVIIASLVTDRVLAILALVVVAGSAWLWQFNAADQSFGRQIAILGSIVVVMVALALWLISVLIGNLAAPGPRLRSLHELAVTFRFAALSRAGIIGLALSCGVILLTVNAVIVFAHGFEVSIVPAAAYLVVPVAVLAAAVPISIAGWGVREASLSYGLMLFATPSADAALLGLTLGIGLVVSALPGGIITLLLGWRLRPEPDDAEAGLFPLQPT